MLGIKEELTENILIMCRVMAVGRYMVCRKWLEDKQGPDLTGNLVLLRIWILNLKADGSICK